MNREAKETKLIDRYEKAMIKVRRIINSVDTLSIIADYQYKDLIELADTVKEAADCLKDILDNREKMEKDKYIYPETWEDTQVSFGNVVVSSYFYDKERDLITFPSETTNNKSIQDKAKKQGLFPVVLGYVCYQGGANQAFVDCFILNNKSEIISNKRVYFPSQEVTKNWFKYDIKNLDINLDAIEKYVEKNKKICRREFDKFIHLEQIIKVKD